MENEPDKLSDDQKDTIRRILTAKTAAEAEQIYLDSLQTFGMFRRLSPDEEVEFRQWARENYNVFTDINGGWHPVVQDECRKMNEEAGLKE